VVSELLARWQTLAPSARTALARQALQRYGAAQNGADQLDELTLRGRLEQLLSGASQP
jgi:hypothetical protein